jgi:AcrR family transcriptional regulator
MAAVAEHAGVSEPTVYRHFSTKSKLFAALGSDLFKKVTVGVAPANIEELIDFLPVLYEQFASLESTVRWNIAAPKDQVVRPPAEERLPILREAMGEALEGLSTAESEFLLRGLLLLTSPTSLLYWQDYLGTTVDEAAETASWMIRQLAKP